MNGMPPCGHGPGNGRYPLPQLPGQQRVGQPGPDALVVPGLPPLVLPAPLLGLSDGQPRERAPGLASAVGLRLVPRRQHGLQPASRPGRRDGGRPGRGCAGVRAQVRGRRAGPGDAAVPGAAHRSRRGRSRGLPRPRGPRWSGSRWRPGGGRRPRPRDRPETAAARAAGAVAARTARRGGGRGRAGPGGAGGGGRGAEPGGPAARPGPSRRAARRSPSPPRRSAPWTCVACRGC